MKKLIQISLLLFAMISFAQTPAKAFRFEGNLLDTAGNDPSFGSLGVTYATSTPTRGQALRINQTGATPVVRARLGSSPGLSTGNTSFSFSFWLNMVQSSNNSTAKIMEYGNSGTATGGYNGVQLELFDNNTLTANVRLTNGSTVIIDNTDSDANHYAKWRFYTVIYNATTSQFSMYIDGALKDSQTVSGGININGTAWTSGDNNAPNDFSIDDFEIFNSALTAAQALTKFKDAIMPTLPSPQSLCYSVNFTGVNITKYTAAPVGIYTSLTDTTSENLNANAVSGNYFASITVAGVESTRVPFTLNVLQPTTPTPVGTYIQTKGQGARLSNLDITGTDLKFYSTAADALDQTNEVNSFTLLNFNPVIYYVTQQNNPCRSSALIISASHDRTTITNAASANVTHRSASITYTINPKSTNVTTPFVSWGLAANALTNTTTSSAGFTGSTAQNSSANGIVLRNLQPSTTYYYDLGATNSFYNEPLTGNVQSFTTAAGPAAPLAPATQTICQPANVAALTATGQNLKWYFSSFDPYNGSPSLSMSNPVSNGLIYVTQTVGGIESAATEVTVTVNSGTRPNAPTAPSSYSFCNVAPAQRLLTAVGATGTDLKWYDSPSATTPVTTASATGIYYVTQSTGVCESTRVAVNITVSNAISPIANNQFGPSAVIQNVAIEPTATSPQLLIATCRTTRISDFSFTDTNGNVFSGGNPNLKWYTNPTTMTPIPNNTEIIYNGVAGGSATNPIVADVQYYVAVSNGGTCESSRVLVVFRALNVRRPVAPTQTTCSLSRFNINPSLPVESYRVYSSQTSTTPLSNDDMMPFGTYYVSQIKNSIPLYNEVEGNRTAFVVQATPITTWNGTSWSNGVPDYGKAVVFAANYTANATVEACNITVNPGVVVTFPTPINLSNLNDCNVLNEINVATTASLSFGHNANLMQFNDYYTNTGKITKTVNTSLKRLDYTYWSSPVADQNLLAFSPNTLANRFYTFNEVTNAFAPAAPATNDFVAGKGYSIRAPNNFTTTAQSFSGVFTGVPNNSIIEIPITNTATPGATGFNLIGNPYPSSLRGQPFFITNPGTIYFWTKVATGQGLGNYASLTSAGGVAATLGGAIPNGNIAAGQGFIFKAATSTSPNVVKFNNGQRTNLVSTFFRTSNNVTANKIWLNLTGIDVFSQVLVAYDANTTNAVDGGYDGEQINEKNTLSTVIDNQNYAIQSRAAFANTDVVPMAINVENAGTYSLSINNVEGIFNGQQNVFVKDNLTGVTHNLSQAPYQFIAAAGNVSNRFELRYEGALSTTTNALDNSTIVFANNGSVNIKSMTDFDSVEIFDIRGALVFEKKDINTNNFSTNELNAQTGILMVRVSKNGLSTVKKLIF
jgi:hypothetical protein